MTDSPSKQPAISVIIPVYNMAEHLRESIDSVLSQSLNNIEIICINDGSTDNSLSILQRYAEKDNRIRIISRANKGVGHSRNEGIEAANGECVAFLDPDDMYPNSDILLKLYTKLNENNVCICGGSLGCFQQTIEGIKPHNSLQSFSNEGYQLYENYQFEYGFYRFIYKRSLLISNHIIFPPYPRFQDPPFMVQAMIKARGFYAIPDITYAYRVAHKKINWDQKKVDGLLAGVSDVWKLACLHHLYKLKTHIRRHMADHYDRVADKLKPNHLLLLKEMDDDLRRSTLTFRKWIFSKHRTFYSKNSKTITLFGIPFRYK